MRSSAGTVIIFVVMAWPDAIVAFQAVIGHKLISHVSDCMWAESGTETIQRKDNVSWYRLSNNRFAGITIANSVAAYYRFHFDFHSFIKFHAWNVITLCRAGKIQLMLRDIAIILCLFCSFFPILSHSHTYCGLTNWHRHLFNIQNFDRILFSLQMLNLFDFRIIRYCEIVAVEFNGRNWEYQQLSEC